MTTLADMRAQIEDDLARGDLTTQVLTAMKTAVRAYETDRFFFNELYQWTATLSTSAASLDLDTLSVRWMKIDRIRRLLSSNNYIDLIPRDYAYIMASQDTSLLTLPSDYCIYANQLQFDCRASADITLVFDGIRRVSSASASDDATVWFGDGADLIRARAKKDLYLHVIKDKDAAEIQDGAERIAYSYLKGRTNQLLSSGTIRATEF